MVGRPSQTLPDTDEAVVAVLTFPLQEPLERIARHPWFAVRGAGEGRWERWEIWQKDSTGSYVRRFTGAATERDGTLLHGVLRGARAERFISCLRRESPRYEHRYRYLPWPGPNSNTYVDTMLRRCGFALDLPPTAIGKDYRGVIGVSLTSGGTGVQLETPLIGFRLGLTEGVELHLLGLAFGVDLWPPALILPVGRFGFADR